MIPIILVRSRHRTVVGKAAIAPAGLRPLFDPRSLLIYLMLAGTFVVALLLLGSMAFKVAPSVWFGFVTWAVIAYSGLLLRRMSRPRFGGTMECLALIYGQGLVVYMALVPLAALSGPFADDTLAHWDRALGFDWQAYANAIGPWMPILVRAYKSFSWQPALLLVILFATGREDRAWRLVTAATGALIFTSVVFLFAPAEGAFVHYHINPSDYPDLHGSGPWDFAPVLHRIKGGARYLDKSLFAGLVSFPSYHASAAIQLVWASWPIKWLRWPIAVLNILMCAAALVVGSHYLVDIIAGLAIGFGAIALTGVIAFGRPHTKMNLGQSMPVTG